MPSFPSRTKGPRKPGRPSGSFTQHRRLDKLRDLLESEPRGLTLEDLATGLRVSNRSVRRYLRELDGKGIQESFLESVETTPGGPLLWRIKPGERGRAVPLRRAQAYAILAMRRAYEVLKGSALYDEIDLALDHVEKVAETPFRASTKAEISGERHLEDRFFWVPPASRSYAAHGEDLDELFRAVADLRVLRFRPRSRHGEPRADRIIFFPYAMVVHRGAILVLGARGRVAGPIEVVALESMTDIRTSETEHFELPPSFDVAEFVHGELGVGEPSRERFVVEFDPRVADDIRTRKIHPQQKVFTAPDGRIRVSLPLVDEAAVLHWILSWGDAARVVDPPELVREVGSILARAAARYA